MLEIRFCRRINVDAESEVSCTILFCLFHVGSMSYYDHDERFASLVPNQLTDLVWNSVSFSSKFAS